MYRKTVMTNKLQRKREKCAAMRAAKERKRIEDAANDVEVGTIIFNGPMFNGRHILTLFARDGEKHLFPTVDSRPFKPVTIKGLRRMIAERIG